MTTDPEVHKVYIEELNDLNAKVRFVLDVFELWSEDGTFCFPDGDVWRKVHSHSPDAIHKRADCEVTYSARYDYLYFTFPGERQIGVPMGPKAVAGAQEEGMRRIAQYLKEKG